MEPINSISPSSGIDFRTVQSVDLEPVTVDIGANSEDQPTQDAAQASNLIEQLPLEATQNVADILLDINVLSLQAAEPQQSLEQRENLQNQATEALSSLSSLFDQLSRDELDILIALFQDQSITFFVDTSSNSSSDIISDTSSTTEDSLENLFQIDLISEQGILSALDFTNGILGSFSALNSDSSFLEDLLALSTDAIIFDTFSTILDNSTEAIRADNAAAEESNNASSSADSQSPGGVTLEDVALAQIQAIANNQTQGDVPSIIDLLG